MASSALPDTSPTNIKTGVIAWAALVPPVELSCHERPYLSCSQPYLSLHGYFPSSIMTLPRSDNFAQIASTSSAVLHFTWNEIEGLNLKSGPALMAMNGCRASSKETTSQSPDGVLWSVVALVIFEFSRSDVYRPA